MTDLTESLKPWIESLIEGRPGAARNLTDQLRAAPIEQLVPLAEHPSSAVREVLVRSLDGRPDLEDPRLVALFERLCGDAVVEVVVPVAELLASQPAGRAPGPRPG